MSMDEELEMLREVRELATMERSVAHLTNIRLVEETVRSMSENALGEDHLGMLPINEAGEKIASLTEQLAEALGVFEETVKGVVDAVIYSLEHPPQ